jgi:hypothetical protein
MLWLAQGFPSWVGLSAASTVGRTDIDITEYSLITFGGPQAEMKTYLGWKGKLRPGDGESI